MKLKIIPLQIITIIVQISVLVYMLILGKQIFGQQFIEQLKPIYSIIGILAVIGLFIIFGDKK